MEGGCHPNHHPKTQTKEANKQILEILCVKYRQLNYRLEILTAQFERPV